MCLVLHAIFIVVLVINCYGSTLRKIPHSTESNEISKNCVLPKHPQFGHWSIYASASQLHPDDLAPHGTILKIACRPNYKLDGYSIILCNNGQWTSQIGQCLRTCPSLSSTPLLTVTCTHNNRKLENCTSPFDGTVAKFKCADFYEDLSLDQHPVHVCYNGRWSHRLPECVPVCGQKIRPNLPLIPEEQYVAKYNYPWQVALYNNTDKNLLCSGSLLNPRVVLTAAHCITDDNGHLLPVDNYVVAVGKYYQRYDDTRDIKDAQFSPVHKMFVTREYTADSQFFLGDIGILVAKKTFKISKGVQPVCVDWGLNHYQDLLDPSKHQHGYVTRWGDTVDDKKTTLALEEFKVSLIGKEDCRLKISENYTKYLTNDKLCAGFLNVSPSLSKWDSGGGLIGHYRNRYYIIGVATLPLQLEGFNNQQYALFTRVSNYTEDFILEKEDQFIPTQYVFQSA